MSKHNELAPTGANIKLKPSKKPKPQKAAFPEYLNGWDWSEVGTILGIGIESDRYAWKEDSEDVFEGERRLAKDIKHALYELKQNFTGYGKDNAGWKDKESATKMKYLKEFMRLLGNGCGYRSKIWAAVATMPGAEDPFVISFIELNLEYLWD